MGFVRQVVVAIALATTFIGGPASAQHERLTLQPASQWQIDYSEESCVLRRSFVSEAAEARLELMQQAPGAYFRVMVTSGTLDLGGANAMVQFDPDDMLQEPAYPVAEALSGSTTFSFTDSLKGNVRNQTMPYIDWTDETRNARERAITSLSIRGGFDRDVVLTVGEMHRPMEALRACMADLYGSWGVDLEAQQNVYRPARDQRWDRTQNAVIAALPFEFSRRVPDIPPVARLIIGADGRVKRCRVHFAPWDEDFSQNCAARSQDHPSTVQRWTQIAMQSRRMIQSC